MGDPGEEVTQNITLQSQPLSITVKPLPELNKPADFNGAVGHYTIEAGIENRKIAARDAGTLKVILQGTGNLPIVNAPQVNWPDSIEAFDPTAKEKVDNTIAPLAGSKTFEYVFTPQKQGKYKLGPVAFSYFDPTSASYKTIESQPLDIEVEPAAIQKSGVMASIATKGSNFRQLFQPYLEWILAVFALSVLAYYLWNTKCAVAQRGCSGQTDQQATSIPGGKTDSHRSARTGGSVSQGKEDACPI